MHVAHAAGIFDGEGWVSIARVRTNGKSDYHKIIVGVAQRAKHRDLLDALAEQFGGRVSITDQRTRVSQQWAQSGKWQLQDKASIERFLRAIQPYAIVKRAQIGVALEFLASFTSGGPNRDALGRVHGHTLTIDEIERRERLRLALRAANELGPPKVKPSQLPPLDLRHRQPVVPIANTATVRHGTALSNAKLTDEAVRAIRRRHAAGESQSALAREFQVSPMLVNGIVRRTRWAHIE